ncbi:Amiloride-sensitive amine oxidase [copper-containing] [Lemmus lemmus]
MIITDAQEHSSVTKFAMGPYHVPSTLQQFLLSQGDSYAHEYPNWMLNGEAQVFTDLSTQDTGAMHGFLMSRPDLELQSSGTQALGKNSVFLFEVLLPKKKDVLEFLDKGTRCSVQEAHAVRFTGAQGCSNVIEFALGPLPQFFCIRELFSQASEARILGTQTHLQSRV